MFHRLIVSQELYLKRMFSRSVVLCTPDRLLRPLELKITPAAHCRQEKHTARTLRCFCGQSLGRVSNSQTVWRRRRDSNPRYAINVYSLSRGAPSATRPLLQILLSEFLLCLSLALLSGTLLGARHLRHLGPFFMSSGRSD